MLKKKLHIPRIMLATALPLVGASVEIMGAGGTVIGVVAIAPASISAPHALQKRLSSLMDSPHFGQNFMGCLRNAIRRIYSSGGPFSNGKRIGAPDCQTTTVKRQ